MCAVLCCCIVWTTTTTSWDKMYGICVNKCASNCYVNLAFLCDISNKKVYCLKLLHIPSPHHNIQCLWESYEINKIYSQSFIFLIKRSHENTLKMLLMLHEKKIQFHHLKSTKNMYGLMILLLHGYRSLSTHKFAYLPFFEKKGMKKVIDVRLYVHEMIWLEKAYMSKWEKGKLSTGIAVYLFFHHLHLEWERSSERKRKRKMWGLYMEMIFVLSHIALHSSMQQVICVYNTHFNINSETYIYGIWSWTWRRGKKVHLYITNIREWERKKVIRYTWGGNNGRNIYKRERQKAEWMSPISI